MQKALLWMLTGSYIHLKTLEQLFSIERTTGWGVGGGGGFCGNYLIIFSRTVFMVGEMEQDGSKEGVFTRYRLAELQLGV